MTADEICNFITEMVKNEERVQSFGTVGEEKESKYGYLVAAVENAFVPKATSNPPKSPTHQKDRGSSHSTPQRGRSPSRDYGGRGRSQSVPRYGQNNYQNYSNPRNNRYPPQSYAQAVRNNPTQPSSKGGKGYTPPQAQPQQTHSQNPPPQGKGKGKGAHSSNYLGGKDTKWAGKCGYCYHAQRTFDHSHVSCPHNPKNIPTTAPLQRWR
jgi:hypothetical protein